MAGVRSGLVVKCAAVAAGAHGVQSVEPGRVGVGNELGGRGAIQGRDSGQAAV